MNERDKTRLQDMLDAAYRSQTFIKGKRRDDLERDNSIVGFAVLRALEIIGEAANHISSETRSNLPQFAWRALIDFRNRVIHGYFSIDYDIVWTIVTVDIPDLIDELEKVVLPEEE